MTKIKPFTQLVSKLLKICHSHCPLLSALGWRGYATRFESFFDKSSVINSKL